jgi:hypothetical protein
MTTIREIAAVAKIIIDNMTAPIIIILLCEILIQIKKQNKWLMEDDEIDNIGKIN